MVFKQELTSVISPTPKFVEFQIYGLFLANILKSNRHINAKTFLKRRHSSNATNTFFKACLEKVVLKNNLFVKYFCYI